MAKQQIIEKLTPEQEAKVKEYYERYLAIGFSTERMNKEEARIAAIDLYKSDGLAAPTHFFFFKSPLQMQREMVYLTKKIGKKIGTPAEDAIIQEYAETRYNKGILLTEKEFPVKKEEFISMLWGGCDLDFVCFYDFVENELDVKEKTPQLEPYSRLSRNSFWWIPCEKVVAFSDRPIGKIHFDRARQMLHNENGPAVEFEDGQMSIYVLNGVRMPDWIFAVPKKDLDPQKIMQIENVEQRLQAIKYIGLNVLEKQLRTKILDTELIDTYGSDYYKKCLEICENKGWNIKDFLGESKSQYELIMLKLNNVDCEFLKMTNPSTGEIHVEGVPPGTKTVREALAFRVGTKDKIVDVLT